MCMSCDKAVQTWPQLCHMQPAPSSLLLPQAGALFTLAEACMLVTPSFALCASGVQHAYRKASRRL